MPVRSPPPPASAVAGVGARAFSQVAAAWNAAHPDIQVRHTDADGGTDSSAKLLTATRAGKAPDIALIEYQTLPAMIVGGVAADIGDEEEASVFPGEGALGVALTGDMTGYTGPAASGSSGSSARRSTRALC